MTNLYSERIVISVGGSLIVPNGGIDTDFLFKFNKLIRGLLAENNNRQFFLVVGGGSTARNYRDAGAKVVGHELTRDDLDWLGIHTTRLNAQLIRTIFQDIAHPYVIKHYEIIRKVSEPVIVAAGWKPGWSTDYTGVLLCQDYHVDTILNLTDVDQVYDKNPKRFEDAKPISKISWNDFRKIVGTKWNPGLNLPFDPIAAEKAHDLKIKVIVLNGRNIENLDKYFHGEKFVGTVIK